MAERSNPPVPGASRSVVLPYWLDRPALEAVEIARNASLAGYPALWAGEMVTFDAFALAATIARESPEMRVTVGPLAVGVRTPASLALGVATVSALGGRPADLALGASTPLVVSRWHGQPSGDPVGRMREAVTAIRALLAGDRSNFDGEHVRSRGFRIATDPPRGTRIVVAAFGEKMLELAANVADKVVVNLVTPAQVASTRERIDRVARAAGRPSPPLAVWVPVAIDPGPRSWEQIARQLVVYVGAAGYGEMFAGAGFGNTVAFARSGAHPRDIAAAIPRELMQAIGAIGNRADVDQRLREYAAAGADELGIVPVTAEDDGGKSVLRELKNS